MNIHQKWKVFSIQHHFSHDPSQAGAADLFDALVACDTQEGVQGVLERFDAVPWEPYQSMNDTYLADSVETVARTTQDIATSDVWVVVKGGMVFEVYSDTPMTVGVIDLDERLDEEETLSREADFECATSLTKVWP